MDGRAPDLLDCDFAEYYHVLDRQSLPLPKAAALAAGLSVDSRVKRELAGAKLDRTTWLLARAADALAQLVWAKTKDARHGRNKPKSILRELLREPGKKSEKTRAFDSAAEFERERARLIGEMR